MERVIRTVLERAAGRAICIFGAGESGVTMYRMLKVEGLEISFFADRKWKQYDGFCPIPVLSSDVLDNKNHFVVFSNSSNLKTLDSMKAHLLARNYSQGDWFNWSDDVCFDILLNGITIGKGTPVIGKFLEPQMGSKLASIGRYTSINPTLNIAINHFIGLSTSFRVPNDEIRRHKLTVSNRIEIGHDVYIGANVFINQSKVKKIGNGAIVGSGAVVIEDVPPYAVVVGVPGKVKKYRFSPKQVELLEQICWWNWDEKTMAENEDCFVNPDLFFKRFGDKQ